jgi:hypothetical protein
MYRQCSSADLGLPPLRAEETHIISMIFRECFDAWSEACFSANLRIRVDNQILLKSNLGSL